MSVPQQVEMCEKQSEVTVPDMAEKPVQMEMGMEGEHEAAKDAADINVGDLKPCCAFIFCTQSLYCKCPECIGVNYNNKLLCYKQDGTCCKCIKPSENEDGACCIVCKGGSSCVKMTSLCEGDCTQFCYDTRCACPPNKDNPALVNLLFFNCVGGKGCCKTIAQLQPERFGPDAKQ